MKAPFLNHNTEAEICAQLRVGTLLTLFMALILTGCPEDSKDPIVIMPTGGMTAGTEVPGGSIGMGCVSDASCPGNICDLASGQCVPGQCSNSTPCPAGQMCDVSTYTCSGTMTPPCSTDANCAVGFCVNQTCQDVQCVRDEHCPTGQRCQGMRCVTDTSCIDGDGDGHGVNCPAGGDCDDRNPSVYEGAPENGATNCGDGIDQNCDGFDSICGSDEDLDRDGYADKDGDCDDMNPNVNPGRAEIYYNDLDDDCNPRTNDDDQDGDGFAAERSMGPDCDDTNPLINPEAMEIPMNGVDEDCDGNDRMSTNEDRDGDGVSEAAGDCNDDDPNVSPRLPEIPYNSLDDDCNAQTRDNDLDMDGFTAPRDCDDSNPNVNPNVNEVYYNGIDDDCDPVTKDGDADGDGFNSTRAGGGDCNDEIATVNPDGTEIEYNGLDDDCDPSTPDNDLDRDGYNRDVDCDDRDETINPGVIENATINCSDNIDHNCVGGDVECDPGALDSDGDGIPDDQDCEPGLANVPGPVEIPNNGIDDDCDGQVDTLPCDDDAFDEAASNGSPVTASAVSDGNTPNVQYGNLIICPDDQDWYQITLNAGDGIEVDVTFESSEGDIDVKLFRRNNGTITEAGMTQLDQSSGVGSDEVVYSARATVRDTYYIKIYQFRATPEPQSYGMTVNVFSGCQDDAVGRSGEHNDTADQATELPPLNSDRQICDHDADWYRFTLNRSQRVRIDVLFSHPAGESDRDIDAQLFNATGSSPIEYGVSIDDNEILDTETDLLPAGEYRVKVYGVRGATNNYRIFKSSGSLQTATARDDDEHPIMDAQSRPGVFTSEIFRFMTTGASTPVPAGAIVRQLKLKQLDINHRCLADLEVNLLWDGEPIVNLWNRDGDNCLDGGLDDDSGLSLGCFGGVAAAGWNGRLGNDICFENRNYNQFAGLDAQGELTVEVIDHNPDNTGSVVDMQFELEYLLP